MAIEIEGKFQVTSHDEVRRRLESLSATRLGFVKEVNRIFDNGARSILAADCGLRVRAFEDVDGVPKKATLTYKGPRQPGALKVREEIEFAVSDPTAACRVLTALGFIEVLLFEKRRETWRLGTCEVELDTLPHLGCYVEIEGPDTQAVEESQHRLGLDAVTPIRSSYIAMLIDHCRERGLDTRCVTFDMARG